MLDLAVDAQFGAQRLDAAAARVDAALRRNPQLDLHPDIGLGAKFQRLRKEVEGLLIVRLFVALARLEILVGKLQIDVSELMLAIAVSIVVAFLALPTLASAQSAIAGVVKDTTGAVLPGVTVEATSPALIERVKTASTNEAGQYRVVDLRPGTYTVLCLEFCGMSHHRMRGGVEVR